MKFERGCVEGTKRWQRMGKKKYFFSLICDLAVLGGETLFAELLFQLLLFLQDSFMLLSQHNFKKDYVCCLSCFSSWCT